MDIFLRPPSTSWEPVALPDVPGAAVWAWFRPPAAPCGIVFQIPEGTHTRFPGAVTVRRLLHALDVDCSCAQCWCACGKLVDAMRGANPQLDEPLPRPPSGADPTVAVYLPPPVAFIPPTAAMLSPVACAGPAAVRGPESIYHAIESDWHAIQLQESKLLAIRKQMNAQLQKLASLNHDLTPEERVASDTQDHRDWQDARRWIRDGVSILSRVVRAHDIGITSAAGHRQKFDDLMAYVITPRRPVENLAEIQHQFEVHRKVVQSLHTEMQSAMHGPVHEGEVKAQTVLNRIRAKVRAAKGKR